MNTNMKKQTAVEWLIEQIFLNRKYITYEESIAFEKAKAIEKEQIIDAVNEGIKQGYEDYIDTEWGRDNDYSPEQYYNETYGGDK